MTTPNKIRIVYVVVVLVYIVFLIPSFGIIFKQIPALHWKAFTNAAAFWWVLIKGLFTTIFSTISWW